MSRAQDQVRDIRKTVGMPTAPAPPQFRDPELCARSILGEAVGAAIALVGSGAAVGLLELQLGATREGHRGHPDDPDLLAAIGGLCDTIAAAYWAAEDVGVDLDLFFDEAVRGKRAGPPNHARVLARVLRDRDYRKRLEREPPPTLDAITAAEWRGMSEDERAAYMGYWGNRGIGSFCCLGCGFPTSRGVAVCEACP